MEDTQKEQKILECITCERNTFHNYKIKLPVLENKYSHALLNIDNLHKFVGGMFGYVCGLGKLLHGVIKFL